MFWCFVSIKVSVDYAPYLTRKDNMSVLIIAEAGVNAGNSLDMAKRLADIAKSAGADIVKYQTAVPELVISCHAQKAQYQKKGDGDEESQLEMIKKLHLTFEEHRLLCRYCEEIGIKYLSTPFDIESAVFLYELGMPIFKIPSGELTNLPLLRKIASFKKPVIMSTGMCELSEISPSVEVLMGGGVPSVTVLHCNTEYPTPLCDVNMKAMVTIKNELCVNVGYSDHTTGYEAAIAATALGATVIEKHFTYDKNAEGPDHKASLSPSELTEFVHTVRATEELLGDGVKKCSKSESKNVTIARKSIVAKQKIQKGELLTEDNITTKRPGDGISPMRWDEVIGTQAVKGFEVDEKIIVKS